MERTKMIDPVICYAIVRDGEVVHVRLVKGVAEACANIEREVHGGDVKVVTMFMTEMEIAE
jgi:hypothetical protein